MLVAGQIVCFGTAEDTGNDNRSERFTVINCSVKIRCAGAQNAELGVRANTEQLPSSICGGHGSGGQFMFDGALSGRWTGMHHTREPQAQRILPRELR